MHTLKIESDPPASHLMNNKEKEAEIKCWKVEMKKQR